MDARIEFFRLAPARGARGDQAAETAVGTYDARLTRLSADEAQGVLRTETRELWSATVASPPGTLDAGLSARVAWFGRTLRFEVVAAFDGPSVGAATLTLARIAP